MSSRRQSQPSISYARFVELVRESHEVVRQATADHNPRAYPPATFACCYAIIRIGEGAGRLDRRALRRIPSGGLGTWEDARNTLAHEVGLIDDLAWLENTIGEPLERLLADLERAAR